MRCIKCPGKAAVEVRHHHSAFCPEHFLQYFHDQVRRNIRRLNMFTHQDSILVAVSGGKDSLALWDVLLGMGYPAKGLHIHLGIGDYSQRSCEITQEFAKERQAPLIVVDVAREYGLGVPQLSRALRRVACSGCGQSKRYIFNKVASENGSSVLVTGHNLDDEAATLLGNLLHWQMEYLVRQAPVLESNHPEMVKKVKPLYTLTERETACYSLLRGIRYVEEECPHAQGARSLLYKDALNLIDGQSPGAKYSFVLGFLEKARPLLQGASARPNLNACATCGQPTTAEVCAFCRMWETARAKDQALRQRTAATSSNL